MAVQTFIDSSKLRDDMAFNENDLDNALMSQAPIYVHYGVLCAKANAQLDRKKNQLEIVRAELDGQVRRDLADRGLKITEKVVEAEILIQPKFQEAQEEVIQAKTVAGLTRTAVEGMEQKQQMIIQCCKRAEAELSMSGQFSSAGVKALRERQEKAHEEREKVG